MIDVAVIGAGQAGLSTSYWLTQHGREHVVLEPVAAVSIAAFDESGLIKTQHEYFDQVELLMQFGLMPAEINQPVDAASAWRR